MIVKKLRERNNFFVRWWDGELEGCFLGLVVQN